MHKTHLITVFLFCLTLGCLNLGSGAAASQILFDPPLSIVALENSPPVAAISDQTTTSNEEVPPTPPEEQGTNTTPEQIQAETVPAVNSSRPKTVPAQTPGPRETLIQDSVLAVPASPAPTPVPHRRTGLKPIRFEMNIRTLWPLVCSWWNQTTLHLRLWYILSVFGLLFYILRWNRLRQPFLFLSLILLGFYLSGPPDPINAVTGLFIPKTAQWWTGLILVAVPVVISLLWGRVFCGWICPLGAVQEFMNMDSSKRPFPTQMDRPLKYLKYLLLIALGYLAWRTGYNYWADFEPSRSLFTFHGSLIALIILGGFLLVSIFISRPFCRYLCPLGAILAITSRIAPFKMRADADRCMVCNKCIQGVCPMDAISAFNPEIDLPSISSAECITCGRCQKVCSKSALRITGFRIDRIYYSKTPHSQKIR